MPWAIIQHGTKYSVINLKTGRLASKSTTKVKAEAQVRLLESIGRRKKHL